MILKFALGSKVSYTDEYLSSESENEHSDHDHIFSVQRLCKVFLLFLAFHAVAVHLS